MDPSNKKSCFRRPRHKAVFSAYKLKKFNPRLAEIESPLSRPGLDNAGLDISVWTEDRSYWPRVYVICGLIAPSIHSAKARAEFAALAVSARAAFCFATLWLLTA